MKGPTFHSDRRYLFAVGGEQVWSAIGSVDHYRRWWPWLRRFEAAGLVVGELWNCEIQPPMPYTLRFTVSVDEVRAPSLVVATIEGDVRGTARLELEDDEEGCRVRIVSSLVPANRTLRAIARVARPLAQFGHAWVLDTGAQQFRARAL